MDEVAPAGGGWAGPLSTRIRHPSTLPAAGAWIFGQIGVQGARWKLWTPVAFGSGAAVYFALLREPLPGVAWLALAAAAAAMIAARRMGSRPAKAALVLVACGLAGFAAAKIRVERVKAPIASADARPQRLQGWVVDVAAPGQGGQRLLIAPYRIGDLAPRATPIRVRVTLRDGAAVPAPGDAISLLAMINTPPPPASPGAYDFARDAFFDSVGGVGFALGAPQSWRPEGEPPWRLRTAMGLNRLRWALTQRIVAVLGPETGGLAAAMATGQSAFIPQEQVDNLRASGLAHIISISGVHMAIVGGFTFAGLRLLIAAWPWLALRINGKKAAAAVALAAVSAYLALSGAPPPAVRSAVTAAIAFGAILVDRQAISLHALAVAAFVVLLLQPEAVTQPGFQMSFAATAALVALAGVWPRPVREINTPWPIRLVQGAGTWFAAAAAISLVAGLATAPFAMQHFNRISTWGLVSNLVVEPISSLLMMPGLAVGAVLTPFGLEAWPLRLAGFAIALTNRVAEAAAHAPFAQVVVASGPAWTLPASFLGLLWVCLWRGPMRWAGLPFALAVTLVPKPTVPDAWVAADGAAVAVRSGGQAILFRPDVKLFGAELWSRRRGLEPVEREAARDAVYQCDHLSCAPSAAAPVRLAAAWNLKRPLPPGRLEALCAGAEVVVLRNDFSPASCAAPVVLTGADFARGGSAELYRQPDGSWRVAWAQDLRGRRPWTWGLDQR
ncbi:MAG TPA: ComEC/Rec2 family competence protein [Phenylobacterium sp.]|uniref:ComEC/Rec2 family competence protein n=1 Tax=Phenylobacterium sp. TaxID=1871053 RepID=UPI002B473AED|nr:ComEC/Rec2 family competence protein [Phenylobacterium sp.]HKR86547.1 ComEC/Rec2 family competence protein [Phenylobacterium sp.]